MSCELRLLHLTCGLLNVREFLVWYSLGVWLFFPQNTIYVVSALMLKVKYCVVTDIHLFIMFNAAGSAGTEASFKSMSFYIILESSSGQVAHLCFPSGFCFSQELKHLYNIFLVLTKYQQFGD